MRRRDLASAALLLVAAAIVLWIRLVPLALPSLPARARAVVESRTAGSSAAEVDRDVAQETARLEAALHYEDAAGRRHVLLGDYDSYLWLRAARNYLRTGSVCDAIVDGRCRDVLTLAPVGTAMRYGRSLHTAAIVAVHRVASWLDPHQPLPASAYAVPVIVGVLGVVPAFAIGRRLAGPVGGFFSAVISGLHPSLLERSLGSDDDVWNVVLPLYMAWAVVAGLQARRRRAQLAGGALGGVAVGVHAATWRGWTFGFAVVLAGLIAAAVLRALHWGIRRRSGRVWQAPGVRTVAAVALGYSIAAAACTQIAGADPSAVRLPVQLVRAAFAPPADRAGREPLVWPSALAQVSELSVPTLDAIAAQSYGNLVFYVAWLGMLMLLLPRSHWEEWHFAVLIGATLLYRALLTAALGRATLIALLALPLAAAAAATVWRGSEADADDAAVGVIVAAWLLAALLMSYEAVRFVLLLAAPFGIVAGVALGRVQQWLDAEVRERTTARAGPLRLLAAAAVLALAVVPVRLGYASAASYLPVIDAAWADTLEQLRATAPPDAIVDTWWDYGYWTEFLAERRVSADGGTLLTRVPNWVGRAQLAGSEAEAVGLLRMLNCGSDAQPYPEGAKGADAKLVNAGLGGLAAYNAIVRLASLDRAAADRHLADLGLDAPARDDVLASTHCDPPASYVIVSSQQTILPGWWQLGTWDPNRTDAAAEPPFGAGRRGFVTADWVPCEPASDGERRCAVARFDSRGVRIDAVVYPSGYARRARVISTAADGHQSEQAPDVLVIAGAAGAEALDEAAAAPGAIAVLLDDERHRALVGRPRAIGSLYTRLMFLDGRGTTRFRKVDERTGAWGERVATWAIDW